MKKYFIIAGLLFNFVLFCSFFAGRENQYYEQEKRIDELLSRMNLDEKIGQLIQIVGMDQSKENLIRQGKAGSVLMGMPGVEEINRLQKIAVEETRLGIPLLFANDIIHGCHTIFPIPLAGASSWNPDLVTEACRIAAFESASEGTRWTYAPMVDIARDPRWGRIMEGAGEDPYLGSVFAAAEVKGFQGNSLKDFASIAACAKHYVAYGGAEGGREYNTVDISERTLREVYLVPFHSAVNNNVSSIMSSFNDLDGIPASANYHTLTGILRNEWNWDGVVISDFNAIGEIINHRFAKNKREAALKSFKAGVDIDMVGDTIVGNVYAPNLKQLVEAGYISEDEINKSVHHVLLLKFKLGLFEHPYTDIDFFHKNNLSQNYKDSIALRLAEESIILLKNENHLLPLGKKIKRVALIGPLADNNSDPMGVWAGAGKPEDVITVYQGFKNLLNGKVEIELVKGCNFNDFDSSGFNDAITTTKKSDVVIMVVGEEKEMSGEASSKTDLNL
ncbi:MAG TPA: glycoside hydrolase family 3 N-terminal domain-containing protein, partial [Ignavibacteriaceae bacterium]|nr:glycoside hydrolase family 3 N-terminal domain-containing protein [Ignavibacteriaceae bacterium]